MPGALWMLMSAVMFSFQLTTLKFASLKLHPLEVLVLRNGMALVPLTLLALWSRPDLPSRPDLFLIRSLFGVAAAAALLSANSLTSLAVVALLFNARIFPLCGFAFLALGEKTSKTRLQLIIVGFAGIGLAILPKFEGDSSELGIALAAGAGLLSASAQISVKALTNYNGALTVSLYSQIGLFLLSIPTSIFVWTTPTPIELCLVAAAATFGGFASLAAANAYKLAPATIVSPIDSATIPLSALLGFACFEEIPSWNQVLGAIVIFTSSYFIVRRT